MSYSKGRFKGVDFNIDDDFNVDCSNSNLKAIIEKVLHSILNKYEDKRQSKFRIYDDVFKMLKLKELSAFLPKGEFFYCDTMMWFYSLESGRKPDEDKDLILEATYKNRPFVITLSHNVVFTDGKKENDEEWVRDALRNVFHIPGENYDYVIAKAFCKCGGLSNDYDEVLNDINVKTAYIRYYEESPLPKGAVY